MTLSKRRTMKRTRDLKPSSVQGHNASPYLCHQKGVRFVNKRFLAVREHVRRGKTLLWIKDTWIHNEGGSCCDSASIDHRPVYIVDRGSVATPQNTVYVDVLEIRDWELDFMHYPSIFHIYPVYFILVTSHY